MSGGVVVICNSTIIGPTYGLNNSSGYTYATNCYAYGVTGGDYNGTMTKITCASGDATGSTGLQNIPYSTANFVNVTSGSEDLHSKSGSALINAGTDLSSTLTTDIRGATRSGTFDIGAFEYTLFPRVRYVKADGSGHYSTLALAEDAEDASGDLVTLNEKLVLVIDGTWASADGVATVDGFTTDATRNITIYATNLARHNGKWRDTSYRILNPAGSTQDGLWIVSSYVNVSGLQFENQYGGGDYAACFSQGNNVVVDGCIARFTGTPVADNYLIGFESSGSNNRFQNCISYGFEGQPTHGYGFLIYTPSANQTVVMNCTAVDNGYGFSAGSGGADFTNCIAQGNYAGFVSSGLGRFGYNKSDVASDVSNGFATLGTVTFVNAAAGDYHLSASDTVAKNNGANYSGLFNSDVDGAARGYVWDIGADDLSIEPEPTGQAVIPTFFILRGGRF